MEDRLLKVNVAKVAGARDVGALACLAPVGRSWRHTQFRIHKACVLGHTPLIEFFMALDLCDGKVFYVVRRQQSELHALHLDKLAMLHGKEGTAQPVSRRHAMPDPNTHGSCPVFPRTRPREPASGTATCPEAAAASLSVCSAVEKAGITHLRTARRRRGRHRLRELRCNAATRKARRGWSGLAGGRAATLFVVSCE